MGKRKDDQKRAAWEQRLARFRASGGTIAKFCRDEGVSDRVFQYWARRIRVAGPQHSSHARKSSAKPATKQTDTARPRATDNRRASIRVRLGSQAQFSIPADALDALRCILSWLRDAKTTGGQDPFQQVIVATR